MIEIGCGLGSLTAHLLRRAARVVGVEADAGLAGRLRERFRAEPRFELVEGDVLAVDLRPYTPAVVCGNIPYYITSPIIEKALRLGEGLERAVFLVQREVAARLGAAAGCRQYGYLSVMAQALCRVEQLWVVKAGAFSPPPKVDSAVVRLTPRETARVGDYDAFLRFAARCFRHKRKTLRNNLGAGAIPYAGRRAEQLTVEQIEQVRQHWAQMGS